MLLGIDVSEHNGSIDWPAVAGAGIGFALVRLGFGRSTLDSNFYQNVNGCIDSGLRLGVYHYSYALSVDDAADEALFVCSTLADCGLTNERLPLGVWYDMEDADGYKAYHLGGCVDYHLCADMCDRWLYDVGMLGYTGGVYASLSWLENLARFRGLAGFSGVPLWVAQWSGRCDWDFAARVWQFSNCLPVGGKAFDGNIFFG